MSLDPTARPVGDNIQPSARIQSVYSFEYGTFVRFNPDGYIEVRFDSFPPELIDTMSRESVVEVDQS